MCFLLVTNRNVLTIALLFAVFEKSVLQLCSISAFQQQQQTARISFASFDVRASQQQAFSSREQEEAWVDVVNAVDLKPVIQAISKYCVTSRGRKAMLSLVGDGSNTASNSANTYYNEKMIKRRKASDNGIRFLDNKQQPATTNLERTSSTIIKVAESAIEAREEYILVQEALALLLNSSEPFDNHQQNNNYSRQQQPMAEDNIYVTVMPPIYNSIQSSPFQCTEYLEDEEDDYKWLEDLSSDDDIELVDILYAEQSIKKIRSVQQWSLQSSASSSTLQEHLAPGIVSFVYKELMEEELSSSLKVVWETVSESVEIVSLLKQQQNIRDQHYLKLSSTKFPILGTLEQQEIIILQDIEVEKQKHKSNNNKSNNNSKNGNNVMMKNVPIIIASSVGGVIKRYIDSGKFVDLVVPSMAVLDLVTKLIQIHDQKNRVQQEIMRRLCFTISQNKLHIQKGLDVIGRVDTLIARASFGYNYNCIYPQHINQGGGCINIKKFIHPVLAILGDNHVIPIDLDMTGDNKRAIIISGANGGGKTLALKSFGLSALMCKLAIPIPVAADEEEETTTTTSTAALFSGNIATNMSNKEKVSQIDFFDYVLLDIGDSQSVITGDSTLMAKLNTCSRIIKQIDDDKGKTNNKEASCDNKSYLVLLDELGSGTDPESGSAIARAILEYLIKADKTINCRVVATTHSPQLKMLPLIDNRFRCASVLLQASSSSSSAVTKNTTGYQLPSYKLAYDISGDSYMLGAASRCQPPLPREIIQNAADYCMAKDSKNSSAWNGDQLLVMQESILRDHEVATRVRNEVEVVLRDTRRIRDATAHLTRKFETKIQRTEHRLNELMKQMKKENGDSNKVCTYDIIGDSLESIRLTKKNVANSANSLVEKGLRLVPPTYNLVEGEMVVVIAQGDWEGETAIIKKVRLETGEIVLEPAFGWGEMLLPKAVMLSNVSEQLNTITLKRNEIALWDYPNSFDEGQNNESSRKEKGSLNSVDRLFSVLSTISPQTMSPPSTSEGSTSKYSSSRERKMINAQAKKLNKGNKKR